MYKIMIVDDEAVVREGIRNNIPWLELGFVLVGVYENGFEAIEAIETLQPEVVLTDICMPFVDGIELTRFIANNFPCTKVILLTGFDEFEYAQQAVKLRAYDFLLKPITANELRKILNKVKTDLDTEKESIENVNKLKSQLNESLPLLKERFLNRLVSGQIPKNLDEKLEYYNIAIPGEFYLVIAIDIDDDNELKIYYPDADEELLYLAISNICMDSLGKENEGAVFQNNDNKTILLLSGQSSETLNVTATRLSEEIRQTVEKYLKFTITVGIGKICVSLHELYLSHKSAILALNYRFLLGKNHVINISDMGETAQSRKPYNSEGQRKLISVLRCGVESHIDEIITNIIHSMEDAYISLERCQVQIQSIVILIINVLNDLGIDETDVFGPGINLVTEVYQFKTLDQFEIWLKELCKKVAAFITGRRNNFYKIYALKAEEYIKEHYQDEDISLVSICKHLQLSTSYFSQIFKTHTKETFIEYVTRIRVEKAMELIKSTGLKTYEIANQVGYVDSHYFSMIFKKAVGLTPTEYREQFHE
jgi:two-component system, response regulator YesN